ncbi:MAG: tetratricopeptide repeat protein [Planctomycetaceae bacterium]|nr:tetratricopeptide repeat protein [Planctomycetaceae bacterium]
MSVIAALRSRRALIRFFVVSAAIVSAVVAVVVGGIDLWLTPDQQAQRLFSEQKYLRAAPLFTDPAWRGTALYRAGEFEDAAQMFARVESATGQFNQGNAWLMHGAYEQAIKCYDAALQTEPEWQKATDNRELAIARAARLSNEGGEMGDQRLGADKIVFDRKDSKGGQDTDVDGGQAMSDQQLQAMWLRRVQTDPGDFLRSKFAYQQALEGAPE